MADINYKSTHGKDNWVSQTEFDGLDLSAQEEGTVYEIVGEVGESDLDADLQAKIDAKMDAPTTSGTSGQVLTMGTDGKAKWGNGGLRYYNHDVQIRGIVEGENLFINFNRVSSINTKTTSLTLLCVLLGGSIFDIAVGGYLANSSDNTWKDVHRLLTVNGEDGIAYSLGDNTNYYIIDAGDVTVDDTVTDL